MNQPTDIALAASRLAGIVKQTPVMTSRTLNQLTGCEIYLKCENFQRVGAFKFRGAYNAVSQLSPAEKAAGVITHSSGNHAQGLALAAKLLGVKAVIVMPDNAPAIKKAATAAYGADIVSCTAVTREQVTADLIAQHGYTLIHPYDNDQIIAGQGTAAWELFAEVGPLDALFVPVGGGGLISGMAIAAKALRPDIRVVGVQSNQFPAMYALKTGKDIKGGGYTLAEGIAVLDPGKLTRQVVMSHVDEMRIVQESRIEEAISLLLDIEKTVVEGAGATGLAALLPLKNGSFRPEFEGRNIGLVLSGGNIDQRFLANVILRNLARSGRIGRIKVLLDDKVGALYELAGIFTRNGGNIIEVTHQRIFGVLSAKNIQTEIEYEIRDHEALDALLNEIDDAGYAYEVMTISGSRPGRALRN